MNIAAIILFVLKASVMLTVFTIGLKSTFADTTYLFRRPGHLFRAILSMNILMPLLAMALVTTFDLHPAVKIAIVVLSVSPVPPLLPRQMLKAGGKEDYTIGLMVAAALLSVIFIPLAMEIVERIVTVPLVMSPITIAMNILIGVLLPLLVGITVRTVAPELADRIDRPIGKVAWLLLVLSVIPVLIGMARPMLSLIGDGTFLSFTAFAMAGLIIGHMLGGPEVENKPALAFATAARHPAIAIAIAHENFPDQKLVMPAVFMFAILSAILSAVYLKWVKREGSGSAPAEARDVWHPEPHGRMSR